MGPCSVCCCWEDQNASERILAESTQQTGGSGTDWKGVEDSPGQYYNCTTTQHTAHRTTPQHNTPQLSDWYSHTRAEVVRKGGKRLFNTHSTLHKLLSSV